MNSLRLHTYPHPVLRTPAQPVLNKNKAVRQLLEDMLEAMRTWGGIGLAAPQAGISQRLVTAEVEHDRLALIDPVMIEGHGSAPMAEGCLSVPGVDVRIRRHTTIWARAYDDGILIIDHGPGLPRATG